MTAGTVEDAIYNRHTAPLAPRGCNVRFSSINIAWSVLGDELHGISTTVRQSFGSIIKINNLVFGRLARSELSRHILLFMHVYSYSILYTVFQIPRARTLLIQKSTTKFLFPSSPIVIDYSMLFMWLVHYRMEEQRVCFAISTVWHLPYSQP